MFYKYFKLILLSSILIQASPKLFNSYGNQIEAFQKDCQTYRKLSLLPKNIKKKCKLYNSKTNRAFKYGYKLDPYIDSDNINLDKVEKYNTLLHDLEKRKENILSLIYTEAKKARKKLNIEYYTLLISNNEMELYSSDYKFMETHKIKFSKHPQYLKYKEKLAEQNRLRLKREEEEAIRSFKLEEARMIKEEKRRAEREANVKKEKVKREANAQKKNIKQEVSVGSLCIAYYENYIQTAKLVAKYAVEGRRTLARLEASGLTVVYEATLKECVGSPSIIKNTKSIYNHVKNLGVL